MKKYRYFGGFIQSQEAWLNKISSKGYRLVNTEKLLYEFEECHPSEYQYFVEFVGEKSKKDSEHYKDFLQEIGYKVFFKNLNLNYSIGKVRYRPWAEKGGRIATTRTTFNKELLIVEKKNDGKPFKLHMGFDDLVNYYSKLRMMWGTTFLLFIIFSIITVSIVIGIFALVCLFPVLFYGRMIKRYRKEGRINE